MGAIILCKKGRKKHPQLLSFSSQSVFPVWVPNPGGRLFLKAEKTGGKGYLLKRPRDKPSGVPSCVFAPNTPRVWHEGPSDSLTCMYICVEYIFININIYLLIDFSWLKKIYMCNIATESERKRRFLLPIPPFHCQDSLPHGDFEI